MSSDIAFSPEEAIEPVKSEIAFFPEEAIEQLSRAERRRIQKDSEKDLPKRFVCPKCGAGERGGPISTMIKMVDEKTKKLIERRVPRYCRYCGGHMVKINDRRMTKKWVWSRASELFKR